jgi:ubiquinone/menaquinone biosynthesis C-methylase UbiE
MEGLAERRYRPWRVRLWELVGQALPPRGRLLEVGVGTGKNMPFWPKSVEITAIDVTPAMLEWARRRAERLGLAAQLDLGDVQDLPHADGTFDVAVATFVFCSVPDPVLGLQQLRRVVRPGGAVVLMEHVRSDNPTLGRAMDLLNPLVVRLVGANINRHTVANVGEAGLLLEQVQDLEAGGIFKLILALVPEGNEQPGG